jgi:hypothetical protein
MSAFAYPEEYQFETMSPDKVLFHIESSLDEGWPSDRFGVWLPVTIFMAFLILSTTLAMTIIKCCGGRGKPKLVKEEGTASCDASLNGTAWS